MTLSSQFGARLFTGHCILDKVTSVTIHNPIVDNGEGL